MRRSRFAPLVWVALWIVGAAADGVAFEDRTPRVHALVGARVVTAPGKVLESATVVVRDGIIEAVGDVTPPADARVWDMQGLTVYAGLIEPYFDLDAAGSKEGGKDDDKKADDAGVRHPNVRVRAERRVVEGDLLSDKQLGELRELGFTTVHLVPTKGIFCGQSAVIDLHDGTAAEQVVRDDVAQVVHFERAGWGDKNPSYPSSLMGAVALVRQTFGDAAWARDASQRYASRKGGLEAPQSNLSWDALAKALDAEQPMPVWLETQDVLGSLRCAALAHELDLRAVLVGNGEEYQHVDELQQAALPMVLPVNHPKAPDVSNEDALQRVELDELQHWERAPGNVAALHTAKIPFALTSNGLDNRSQFRREIRKAIEAGLPEAAALAAVTTQPAQLLGIDANYGTIQAGKVAQLTVTDGDLFAKDTDILEVWVNGDRYEIGDSKRDDVEQVQGTWRVVAADSAASSDEWTLEIKGNEWTLRGELVGAQGDVALDSIEWKRGELRVTTSTGETLLLEPAGKKELEGTWRTAAGAEHKVAAKRPAKPSGDTQ